MFFEVLISTGSSRPSPWHRFCRTARLWGAAIFLLACLLALTGRGWCAASAEPGEADPVGLSAELFRLPENDPSGRLLAVLWLTPAPGWHTSSADPAGAPQTASAALAVDGVAATAIFPPGAARPDPFEPEKTVLVYEAKTPVFVPLPNPAGQGQALTGQIRVFSCSDTSCWPSVLDVRLPLAGPDSLPPAAAQPWWPEFLALRSVGQAPAQPAAPANPAPLPTRPHAPPAVAEQAPPAPAFSPRSFTPALEVTGLVKAAALAFLAGLILNFMPCVLPVVSLKLSGLLAVCGEEGREERGRHLREHNFFFALGIVVYFLILSFLLGAFGLAWGEMFQSPTLAVVVAVVLFALSLSLFGVFHLPVVDLKVPGAGRGHTRRGAFFTGVLATLLATPCSGPFLGGVLAWTLLQPLAVVMTVFAVIGCGMASPYAMLAIWPKLVRFLPRPGAWMQALEKGMAFLLAATCIYFLTLLPPHRLLPALAALWATGLGAYLYGKGANLSQALPKRLAIRTLALAVAGAGLAFSLAYAPPDEAKWISYTPEAFEARLGKENLVLDFTADWCPTCKFLERTVLTPPRLAEWSKRHEATFMKVDLTSPSPTAMELLRALDSRSIPAAAFFPKGEAARTPLVLRDLFTASQFGQALDEAFGQPHANGP